MADREFRYRVSVDTASAKAAAAQVRQTFQREMAQVQAGGGVGGGLPGLNLGMLGKAAGALGIGLSLAELTRQTLQMAELGTQINRTTAAFVSLSGGSAEAAARLSAVQRASGGAIDKMTAMQIANKAAALGMATTSAELERVTRFARTVSQVFGIDMTTALDNLALAASNLSFVRLDQMGVSASEVRKRFEELKGTMSDSQAFLTATLEVGERTFAGMASSADKAASSIEILRARLADLRAEAAQGIAGGVEGILRPILSQEGLLTADEYVTRLRQNVEQLRSTLETRGAPTFMEQLFGRPSTAQIEAAIQQQLMLAEMIEKVSAAAAAGAPGADAYLAALQKLAGESLARNVGLDMMASKLAEINRWLNSNAVATALWMAQMAPAGQFMSRLPGTRVGQPFELTTYRPPADIRTGFTSMFEEWNKKIDEIASESTKSWERAADRVRSAWESAISKFESRLSRIPGIPGISGPSPVTEEDILLSKYGLYRPKPDEPLRRLAAEVLSGKEEYPEVDIYEAARRVGLAAPEEIPPEVLLKYVQQEVYSGRAFAGEMGRENMAYFLDQAAIQEALAQQRKGEEGTQALLEMLKLSPEGAAMIAEDAGKKLNEQFASDQFREQAKAIGEQTANSIFEGFSDTVTSTPWGQAMLAAILASLNQGTQAATNGTAGATGRPLP